MAKFKFNLGDIVLYSGNNNGLKAWFNDGMTVCGIIPVGDRTSSGEINNSGQTIYRVRHGSTYYIFPEDVLNYLVFMQ
jgi:hypothetical protein